MNKMPIFLRAHTELPARQESSKSQSKRRGSSQSGSRLSEPAWPEYALIFDAKLQLTSVRRSHLVHTESVSVQPLVHTSV